MHWTMWIIFPAWILESSRGIANAKNIIWLQTILNQKVFTHLGNVDNAWFITIIPLIVISTLHLRNRKIVRILIILGIILSIYAVLDEELLILPLLNQGTPDLLDIPGGVVGWICGVLNCRYWLRRKHLL